ncbi:LemA family protein [Candidatus Gracilibacteria bacterium]|nr:LemA family protein [Candidatus Gracilibacteria bacterium]
MQQQLLMGILSVLFLIIIGSIFLFFYFRSVRDEIEDFWITVLKKLRDRQDKIPRLIESIREIPGIDAVLINELITLRSSNWPITSHEKNKITNELLISQKIHQIWDLENSHPDLKKNIAFLAIKSEFKDCGSDLEKTLEVFNKKIRHYNKLRNFFLIRPFMWVLHYKKVLVFEFEA